MAKARLRHPVLGPCPKAFQGAQTHAYMNSGELSRFRGALIYWCPLCRIARRAGSSELHLSSVAPSIAAEPATAQIGAAPA